MSENQAVKDAVSQEMLDEFARLENNEVSANYRIVGKQGAGGCSVVYDAWRILDGRHVAIKVLALPEGLEEEEAEVTKRRFFREARILSSLKNEHSVECVEYGLFNGAPCVVLEFVEGVQLDEFLRDFGALPFEYGVGIICQVLEALGEAHGKGIIHRDIKPANILVIQESDPPVVRLIDFGIATLQEGALGELMRTRLGVVRGTPSYMAPELFTGQVSATPESDIYAIGLVLCEILTGMVCVAGGSLMQIAFKQAHEELEIPALIPECLAKIIRKCCEKSADNRYHSAADVIKDLKECLPEAIQQRAACEQAYLESIKEGGDKKGGMNIKGFSKYLIVGGIVLIVGLVALLGYTHSKRTEEEAAAKAQQEKMEVEAKIAAAEAEAKRLQQEADQKTAIEEAARKAAEEAAKLAAADKAVTDAQIAELQRQAQQAEEARLAAERERQRAEEEARKKSANRRSSNTATSRTGRSRGHNNDLGEIPSGLF